MLRATAQEKSTRTFSRTSVDIWEASHRDSFLTSTHLYPRNLLFIEELCTILVFCSIHTQTPLPGLASEPHVRCATFVGTGPFLPDVTLLNP
jgi:hypothetical protein